MVCHGELVRLKPAPQYLTSFYLMISVGGAVGGVFVGLLAPRIFHARFRAARSESPPALIIVLVVLFRGTISGGIGVLRRESRSAEAWAIRSGRPAATTG